ncbi:MAG: 6-carboxytetrahydropterin synthase [Candidatus Eisenbacteria bacterium]|nr:6-carboxytetrahydropterin synthase [Candidatus Eisenbacteria bacterium]
MKPSPRAGVPAPKPRRRSGPVVYLTKQVEFSASHRLFNPDFSWEKNCEVFGICNNPNGHGHNYVLDVTLAGRPDPQTGMIIDLKQLKEILDALLIAHVDHKNLNLDVDFLQDCVPTVENLVIRFWERLDGRIPGCVLHELSLYESRTNFVRYQGAERKSGR